VASTSTRSNTKASPADELVQRAVAILLDSKANDVVVLNLKGVTDMTDYFVIASGTSDTHVRSLGEHVMEGLKKDGNAANHVEGLMQGRWVLLDYVDFVVHLFHPTLRSFYQLERLWSDAEVVSVPAQGAPGHQ
jgi:ribosome-associated protein